VINGEKAAFNNSVFGKRRKRTIEAIINNLHKTYEKEGLKVIHRILNLFRIKIKITFFKKII
jgi:hypothetical protein